MRVLIASKILVVAAYRRKLDALAALPGIDHLVAVTPPAWSEPGGRKPVRAPAARRLSRVACHRSPRTARGGSGGIRVSAPRRLRSSAGRIPGSASGAVLALREAPAD